MIHLVISGGCLSALKTSHTFRVVSLVNVLTSQSTRTQQAAPMFEALGDNRESVMKNQKPLSSKKPPEPSEDHQLIEEWIANTKPALNPVVSELDKLILKELKNPRHATKWGKAYYGSTQLGWCIELVSYDVSVNVVFLNGSQLNEPPELGDRTRYVKIKNLEEAKSDQVLEWIKQSCQISGWAW